MKIALIGYGKMGHAVEKIALARGHEIVAAIDEANQSDIDSAEFAAAQVAVEFTTPASAPACIEKAVAKGVRVVSGSTGWYDSLPDVARKVEEANSALLAASNFSIGVYVSRLVARRLAEIMGHLPQYNLSLSETHHIHKLDYPSGTALTMAADIVEADSLLSAYTSIGEVRVPDGDGAPMVVASDKAPECMQGVLPVLAIRRGEVPGIHTLSCDSEVDTITLTHEAKSRDGFALGAVMAAEWLADRKGVFSIDDMMKSILNIPAL